MSLFPIFVKLEGRAVVVVGGGVVAEQKLHGLFKAKVSIRVVAPEVTSQIAEWAGKGRLVWQAKRFSSEDLEGALLVIAATSAPGLNEAVFREADARGILCNAVDDIANCHFYYGAVVQRGDLQIAISTNGKSPALAQRIRKELEAQYGEEYGAWLDWLGATRELLRANSDSNEQTTTILHALASQESFERFRAQLDSVSRLEGAA
jgi:siroheme synthase-like protein